MTDPIITKAEAIQSIASKELHHLDYDDLSQLWKLAAGIIAEQKQRERVEVEATLLAGATHTGEVWEYKV